MIGSRLELLVDDALIERMEGVAFKLHAPRAAEVSLVFDQPWEGAGNHYLTVFKDTDRYRLFYHSVVGKSSDASGSGWVSYTCGAESKDGIAWTRPNLGIHEFNGSKENNIIYPKYGFKDGALLYPHRDVNPAAPPERRYLAPGVRLLTSANSSFDAAGGAGEQRGLFLFASADAVHWRTLSDEPIVTNRSVFYSPTNLLDSDNSLFWDVPSGQYFLYIRDQWLAPGSGAAIRGMRRTTSKDLVHWSYPEWIQMHPSPPDEFYTSGARPYFRAPHFYLAFPMRFLVHRNAPLPPEYEKQRGKGLSDTVFMSSRDGLHWDRRFLDAFIRPGLDPLKWTDRSNHTAQGLVPTGPNEMSVYVLEYFRLPAPQVRRYAMRTDGIASINAPYAGGEFTTKPLVFSGRRLVINASTSAAGGVRVEILDADGRPLDRYARANAIEFFGDSIEQEVRWDQGPDLSALAGQSVRLRFLLKDADLYAFQFKDFSFQRPAPKPVGARKPELLPTPEMKSLKLIPVLLSVAAGLAGLVPASAQQPVRSPAGITDIGSRRELFVDDFMIERLTGKAGLRLHQPTPREVVSDCSRSSRGSPRA